MLYLGAASALTDDVLDELRPRSRLHGVSEGLHRDEVGECRRTIVHLDGEAERLAVLTPHQPSGDDIVRGYLKEAGLDVVKLVGLKCPSPWAIALTAWTPRQPPAFIISVVE